MVGEVQHASNFQTLYKHALTLDSGYLCNGKLVEMGRYQPRGLQKLGSIGQSERLRIGRDKQELCRN